jgi:hypothetical protein
MAFMGTKRRRILLSSDKIHLKKIFQEKDFRPYTGASCKVKKFFFFLNSYLFISVFCHKGKFIF